MMDDVFGETIHCTMAAQKAAKYSA
jgi:hypothetical protein